MVSFIEYLDLRFEIWPECELVINALFLVGLIWYCAEW